MTDPGSIASAVAALDRLRGDYASAGPHASGSPAGTVYVYTVTFHCQATRSLSMLANHCAVSAEDGNATAADSHKPSRTTRLDNALAAGLRT